MAHGNRLLPLLLLALLSPLSGCFEPEEVSGSFVRSKPPRGARNVSSSMPTPAPRATGSPTINVKSSVPTPAPTRAPLQIPVPAETATPAPTPAPTEFMPIGDNPLVPTPLP